MQYRILRRFSLWQNDKAGTADYCSDYIYGDFLRRKELAAQSTHSKPATGSEKKSFFQKLFWLSYLLWGGSFLLAYEHLWHGEVVPWFPFLTAASDPVDAAVMLQETASVGTTMALLITAVWIVMLLVSNAIEKRPKSAIKAAVKA